MYHHAFVTQTHVGFAVPATLAAVLGLGWALASRRRRAGFSTSRALSGRLWLWSGLLLAVLCWALPLADLIWGSGNLLDLFRFFLMNDRTTTSWNDALAIAGMRLSEPMLPLVAPPGADGGSLVVLRHFLSALLAVGVVAAVWRARRRHARFELVLATIVLLQFLALSPVLAQISPEDPRYLSEWVLMLSVLGGTVIAMSWRSEPLKGVHGALVAGATVAILTGALVLQAQRVAQRLPVASQFFDGITADVVSFADAVEPHLGVDPAPVLAAEEPAMSMFAGTLCLLYKRGYDPVLEDTVRMRSLFGRGFVYRTSSAAWILFSPSPRPDGDLLQRGR